MCHYVLGSFPLAYCPFLLSTQQPTDFLSGNRKWEATTYTAVPKRPIRRLIPSSRAVVLAVYPSWLAERTDTCIEEKKMKNEIESRNPWNRPGVNETPSERETKEFLGQKRNLHFLHTESASQPGSQAARRAETSRPSQMRGARITEPPPLKNIKQVAPGRPAVRSPVTRRGPITLPLPFSQIPK